MALLCFAGPYPALADPTDFGTCVSQNKQFGGATAACAEDICNWEVCKDQIIYSTGSTGMIAGAPESYSRNAGEEGSALAVCMPKQQIMSQCLRREAKAAAKPKEPEKPKPAPWCKTGSDADIPRIHARLDERVAEINEVIEILKPLQQQYREHQEAIDAAREKIDELDAEYHADVARYRANKEDLHDWFYGKWETSGRREYRNEIAHARNDQVKYRKELWTRIDPLQQQKDRLIARFKSIADITLNSHQDCAGAKAALQ
jgi:hypothetical protein